MSGLLEDFVRSRLAASPKLSAGELRAEWIPKMAGDETPPTKAEVKRIRDRVVAELRSSGELGAGEAEGLTLDGLTERLAQALAAGERGTEIRALVSAWAQLSGALPKGPAVPETEDWSRLSDPEVMIMAALSRKLHGAPNDAAGLHALDHVAAYIPLAEARTVG